MSQDWIDKDFYQTLGINDDATPEEIKSSYRKLAQQYHPDLNQDNPAAEEKFKDVSEAYAVLADQEKKAEYDQIRRLAASGAFAGGGFPGGYGPTGGYGGHGGSMSFDLDDLLGGLGGIFGQQGRGGGRAGARQGANLTSKLSISFEEAVQGLTTTVAVRGEARCSQCGGNGSQPGVPLEECTNCRGAGTIFQNQGSFSFSQSCPDCGGAGKKIKTPCSQCRGRGTEVRTRNIKVKIPAGVKNGATIRLAGKGAPGRSGGPAGDLLIKIRVGKHQLFGRRKDNLTLSVPISYTEAVLGTKLQVPDLEGNPVTFKIPKGTPSGKTFRIPGRGVQRPGQRKQGDLLVTVQVEIPPKVSRETKKILEQLSSLESENLREHLQAAMRQPTQKAS